MTWQEPGLDDIPLLGEQLGEQPTEGTRHA